MACGLRAVFVCLSRVCGLASFVGAPVYAQACYQALARLPGGPVYVEGQYATGLGLWDVMDVNGDGVPDLLGALGLQAIALGDGRGGFGAWMRQPMAPFPGFGVLDYGDLDGDGDIDAYCGTVDLRNPSMPDRVFVNDGLGSLVADGSSRVPDPGRDVLAVELADVDGDGDLDAVVGGGLSWWNPGGRGRNWVYLNDGTGRFSYDPLLASMPSGSDDTAAIVSGDLDGDGDVDLVFGNIHVSSRVQNQSKVYLNDGAGRFSIHQSFPANRTWIPHLFDLEGDGDLDLAFFSPGNTAVVPASLYQNDGSGQFTEVTSQMPSTAFSGADIGDVDGDGDQDIVCVSLPSASGNNPFRVVFQWVNDGHGRFRDVTASTMPTFSERSAWGAYQVDGVLLRDMDMDGDLDAVLSDTNNLTPPDNNPILWNMMRHVYPPAPARIGQSYTVDFYARPGNVVLPAAAFAPARVELPGIGVLGLDPASLIVGTALRIPASGDKASLTFQVPQDSSLVGRKLYWQGLEVDPQRAPFYFLTNTFEETIES